LGAPSLDIRRNLAEGLWIEEGGAAALWWFTTQITKRNRCSDSTQQDLFFSFDLTFKPYERTLNVTRITGPFER